MSNWDDEVNRHAAELVRLTLKAADQGPEPLPEDEVAELCARPGRGVLLAPHRGRSRSRGEADGSCVWTSPGSMGLRERHSGACEGARRPCARSSPRAAPVPVATTRGTDGRERRAASLSSSSRCSPPRICGATPSPCVTRKAPSMDSSRCGRSTGARSPTAISRRPCTGPAPPFGSRSISRTDRSTTRRRWSSGRSPRLTRLDPGGRGAGIPQVGAGALRRRSDVAHRARQPDVAVSENLAGPPIAYGGTWPIQWGGRTRGERVASAGDGQRSRALRSGGLSRRRRRIL